MLAVNFLLLGAVLFCIGVFGVLARRNAVMVLMSVELILNAVNLNLIAFALMHGNVDGQVFALYVIAVAAAEVGVGLGMVLLVYRNRRSIALDELSRDEGMSMDARPARGLVPRERLADPGHPGRRLRRHHPLRQAPADEGRRGRRRLDGGVARARVGAVQWIQRTTRLARQWIAARPTRRSIAASEAVTPSRTSRRSSAWTWWQSGGVEFGIGQHIDGLAVMVLFLVAFISLLVQIYSLEYVRGDRRYTHFFAAITLFSAGMLVMVLAENMVQLILGWEIMGLCSFMLIGHWWEEEPNARAALKAFFTVRVGDVGLLVGTAILFFGANSWAQEQPRHQRLQHPGHLRRGRCPARAATPCCCGRRSPCSSPASARAASSRCTPGCPTRWPARRRCRRCCTPRRWSSPACSSSPASTRCSGRASRSPTSAST